jgi:hypothetical protein
MHWRTIRSNRKLRAGWLQCSPMRLLPLHICCPCGQHSLRSRLHRTASIWPRQLFPTAPVASRRHPQHTVAAARASRARREKRCDVIASAHKQNIRTSILSQVKLPPSDGQRTVVYLAVPAACCVATCCIAICSLPHNYDSTAMLAARPGHSLASTMQAYLIVDIQSNIKVLIR